MVWVVSEEMFLFTVVTFSIGSYLGFFFLILYFPFLSDLLFAYQSKAAFLQVLPCTKSKFTTIFFKILE